MAPQIANRITTDLTGAIAVAITPNLLTAAVLSVAFYGLANLCW